MRSHGEASDQTMGETEKEYGKVVNLKGLATMKQESMLMKRRLVVRSMMKKGLILCQEC